MKELQIIGTVKCRVQYRYVDERDVIHKSELIGVGFHETVTKEFSFPKFDIPKDPEKESLTFRNGRTVVDGKTYVIDVLNIGNVGISTLVRGDTAIGTRILDRTVEIIDVGQPFDQLRNKRKVINKKCEMKVKLDIDPQLFFSDRLVSIVKEFSDQMKLSEFSKVDTHFVAFGVAFVSQPEVEQILERTSAEQVEAELKIATGMKSAMLGAGNPGDYKKGIFDVSLETDLSTAKEMLTRIEEALSRA